MDIKTKYDDLQETELLRRALNAVRTRPDLVDYFVINLSECDDVCGHGRATRLVDVMAMAQDVPIIPDALIKKQLTEQLQSIYKRTNQNTESTKQEFDAALNLMAERGVID